MLKEEHVRGSHMEKMLSTQCFLEQALDSTATVVGLRARVFSHLFIHHMPETELHMWSFRWITQVEKYGSLLCLCVIFFLCLCYYLKGKETLGQSPREITFPFFFLFLYSFLFCSPSLCRPSSALLISLRYGSQWHLISLLCNNQSCCFFLMLSQPCPLILSVHRQAVLWCM